SEEFRPIDARTFRSASGAMRLAFEDAAAGKWRRLRATDRSEVHALTRVEPFIPTAEQLAEYAGEFYSQELDAVFRITRDGGRLTLHRLKAGPAPMEPLTADLFQLGNRVTVEFVRDADRRITGFLYSASRIRNLAFTRKRV